MNIKPLLDKSYLFNLKQHIFFLVENYDFTNIYSSKDLHKKHKSISILTDDIYEVIKILKLCDKYEVEVIDLKKLYHLNMEKNFVEIQEIINLVSKSNIKIVIMQDYAHAEMGSIHKFIRYKHKIFVRRINNDFLSVSLYDEAEYINLLFTKEEYYEKYYLSTNKENEPSNAKECKSSDKNLKKN